MARPRKPRTKSGRLSRSIAATRDQGTPELQAKRLALVGANGDPALSSTVPGILHANTHLDEDQYVKAMRWRFLRSRLYGPPWPAINYGGDIPEIAIAAAQAEFDAMCSLVTAAQKHVVSAVCVFDQIPNWFFAARLKLWMLPEDEREKALLIDGLNALVKASAPVDRNTCPVIAHRATVSP